MGYKVLGRTEELLQGYTARKGLEGPFIFGRNRVLYYDPREGQYWDPRSDWYLSHEEMDIINNQLMDLLRA